ncbi:MAG: ABC transporter ATP-binding protein [Lacunisphaera sp.]|nr:ABC transporter ATP-binding protein [Lacunisphaera sp.]
MPSAEAPWAVEFAAFAKSYPTGWTGGRIHALRPLTLQLAAGQVLGLLGPNGSGKSTTLKALAGLIAPTEGTCRIFGQAAGSDAARTLVGYLPEAPQFSPHQTGREFLHYCAGLSSLGGATATRRVDEVLRWSGLGEAAERKVGTYSKGMTQRVGLAQAVLHEPRLVLLDEPAGGLDPEGRLALNRLIRDLAARGTTVVFSSHLLAQAEEVCDRLVLLGRGRLLAEGAPAELLGAERDANPGPSRLEKLYLEKLHAHE